MNAVSDPSLPSVPPPPGFRAPTRVVGDEQLKDAVDAIFSVAPEMQGRVDLITDLPTSNAMKAFFDADLGDYLEPQNFSSNPARITNLGGMASEDNSEMHIAPGIERSEAVPQERALAHEFGHVLYGPGHSDPRIKELEDAGEIFGFARRRK